VSRAARARRLRERAEQLVAAARVAPEEYSALDLVSLVHELQVHQVELETQNEELRAAQIELADARDRYADLYEFAPVGYLTLDAQHVVREANLTATRLLNVERATLIGSRFEGFFLTEDRDACHRHLTEAAGAGGDKTCELRVMGPNGQIAWGLLETVWHETAGGVEWRVIVRDVTARKLAEEQLLRLKESLEERVQVRTGMLRLLNDVAAAANEAGSLDEALAYTLRRVCEQHGWCFGHAFLLDESSGELVAARPAYAEPDAPFRRFRAALLRMRLQIGEGLPGRVLADKAARWSQDIAGELLERGAEVGGELRLRSWAAFPIFAGSEAVGVLEFCSIKRITATERVRGTMASVGTLLGRVVERHRFQRAIARALLSEQQRVTQDLHDTVGQELAGLALIADRAARQAQGGASSDVGALKELSHGLRHALEELRTVVRDQLPPVAARPEDFVAALQELTGSVSRRHKLACELECSNAVSIPAPDVALHLYRIAAEAITNAIKHAHAKNIRVRVHMTDGMLVLEVRDDGTGIPKETHGAGAGLQIMRHRAHVIGGSLVIQRGAESGTVVRCELPRVQLRGPREDEVSDDPDASHDRR